MNRYNEHFRIFVKLWKGLLTEKKELAAKFKEYQKANSNLESATKKMSKAEQKEPHHKVVQRQENLQECKTKEMEAAENFRKKVTSPKVPGLCGVVCTFASSG